MNRNKKTGWIIGIIFAAVLCLIMFIIFFGALSDVTGKSEGPSMSPEEMGAHCYRASELYCAGIYYTDKALSADPQQMTYDEWKEYVDKAEEYWDELDYTLGMIKGYANTEGFQKAFADTEIKTSAVERLNDIIVPRAYAYESSDIIKTFDGAQAGHKLEAVANMLGKDKQYAFQALQVAQGEITAQSWNDYGDTAMHIEQGLRVAKTAGQGCAIAAGVLAAADPLTTLEATTVVVSGASCIWQLMDDGAFILMGDDYQKSEFVVNLSKVSDSVAPVAFAGSMLTLNFSAKDVNAVLSSITVADTLRGLFQDDKIAGIQLSGNGGKITSMTKAELLEYKTAKENGQSLPGEIEALLKALYGDDDEEEELPEYKVTADKPKVQVEEWVAFTVQDTKPEYTYVWEYGSNKNPQDTATFSYMYQVAGTYTMYVTILDEDGEAIGRGSCSVEVVDIPEPDEVPDVTPAPAPEPDTPDINISGRYVYDPGHFQTILELKSDGTYCYTHTCKDYTTVEKGTYEIITFNEDGETYYRMNAHMTGNRTTYSDGESAPTTSEYSWVESDTYYTWKAKDFDANGRLSTLDGLLMRE